MLEEKKIRSLVEEELEWLERFAATERTNIYKNDIVEADRRIIRISTMCEVLEEVPNEDILGIIKIIKEKLE